MARTHDLRAKTLMLYKLSYNSGKFTDILAFKTTCLMAIFDCVTFECTYTYMYLSGVFLPSYNTAPSCGHGICEAARHRQVRERPYGAYHNAAQCLQGKLPFSPLSEFTRSVVGGENFPIPGVRTKKNRIYMRRW